MTATLNRWMELMDAGDNRTLSPEEQQELSGIESEWERELAEQEERKAYMDTEADFRNSRPQRAS